MTSLSHLLEKDAAPVAGRGPLKTVLRQAVDHPDNHAVSEDQLIDLHDYPRHRQDIFDKTLKGVEAAFPKANTKHTLTVTDLHYDGPDHYSKEDYKNAILERRSMTRKLVGKYVLTDNATGKVISTSGRKTIMNVPYLTDQGTFLRNGTESVIPRQLRLQPGVYTHMTSDGYPEAQFNVKPGTGSGFRTYLDPETSVFYMTTRGRKIPLYPLMQALGVDDRSLQATWGDEIFKANQEMRTSSHAARWLNEMNTKLAPKVVDVPEVEEQDVNPGDEELPTSNYQETPDDELTDLTVGEADRLPSTVSGDQGILEQP